VWACSPGVPCAARCREARSVRAISARTRQHVQVGLCLVQNVLGGGRAESCRRLRASPGSYPTASRAPLKRAGAWGWQRAPALRDRRADGPTLSGSLRGSVLCSPPRHGSNRTVLRGSAGAWDAATFPVRVCAAAESPAAARHSGWTTRTPGDSVSAAGRDKAARSRGRRWAPCPGGERQRCSDRGRACGEAGSLPARSAASAGPTGGNTSSCC